MDLQLQRFLHFLLSFLCFRLIQKQKKKTTNNQKLTLQCSASCGYGIQSRAVPCMGPSHPQPLSPSLCMHMPKPITIQSCSVGSCGEESPARAGTSLPPTDRTTPPGPTEASTILQSLTTPIAATKPSQCADYPFGTPGGSLQTQQAYYRRVVLRQMRVGSFSWSRQALLT